MLMLTLTASERVNKTTNHFGVKRVETESALAHINADLLQGTTKGDGDGLNGGVNRMLENYM